MYIHNKIRRKYKNNNIARILIGAISLIFIILLFYVSWKSDYAVNKNSKGDKISYER